MNWIEHWQRNLAEVVESREQIDQLADDGYVVVDAALPDHVYRSLVAESLDAVGFQAAKISAGGRAESIRSDATRWIERHADTAGDCYLAALEGLSDVLNQSFYLGIRSVEAHYACYQPGQFYAEHRDNAQGSSVRAISTVLYLNGMTDSDWQSDWGGALRLVDRQACSHMIRPIANRLVIFDSDLCHEVLAATHVRRSIAGWLRRDGVT